MAQETTVLIVGAGPAGLATSACLNLKGIQNMVLEREDCCASMWKTRAYDRLKLHLAKQFCELPHMSFPSEAPTFVPKQGFIEYLDDYASKFNVNPFYNRCVESATYDDDKKEWLIEATNTVLGEKEMYASKFLVVATGENSEGLIPGIPGLDSFEGIKMHSSWYVNGKQFEGKEVLVMGSGNSGMEIAFDLSSCGAKTSIVVRSPVHYLTKEMVQLGMTLLKEKKAVAVVDYVVLFLSKLMYGNLEKYGIQRPSKGPFYLKMATGRSPVIDVGTVKKIKNREIDVCPAAIEKVNKDMVHFSNGDAKRYDAIVFATGFKSSVRRWLKDDGRLFNDEGMPKNRVPNHWKGDEDDGIYCAGFARAGLFGISNDAKAISQHIQHSMINLHGSK